MKETTKPPTQLKTPAKILPDQRETYLAPPPPAKGKIIGLDCHPDTFTAAVFQGSTPHDAHTFEKAALTLGQSCPLISSFPSALVVALKESEDFKTAILGVLRGGGDNAGRAAMVGA